MARHPVSVKSHDCGTLNPIAPSRDALTVGEVLASRTISCPLTLLMCSPIGDGKGVELFHRARVPINASRGLLSREHPVGATGYAQLTELTNRLRGGCGDRQVDGARVAIAENGGGYLGDGPVAAVVTPLGR